MRRKISLVLAIIIVCTMFSACSDNKVANDVYDPTIKVGDTGGLEMPLVSKPTSIQWQVVSSDPDISDRWFFKKLEGITGVDIELIITQTATTNQKLQTLIAGGNIPDIIGATLNEAQSNDLCMQGAFAAVEDYIDVMPNFKKIFVDNKENNWIFDAYAAADGKLYSVNSYDVARDINHTFMYRKDIFDKHGIKMWTNPDEFYAAMKKLKEIYPDSMPYTSKMTDQIFSRWAPGWGIKAHEPYFDEADNTWKYSDTDPKYKVMLDFMKKLYDEGLMDPEFLTNTQSAWTQKMAQKDKAFVTFDWIDRMTMFKEQTKETLPEYDLRFANPVGPEQTYAESSKVGVAKHVKKQSEDREKVCFQLLDFMYSPFGTELMTMGIEGETYELDENGMAKYIEFDGELPSMTELVSKYGMFTQGMYSRFDRRSTYFNFPEQLKEAQDYVQDKTHVSPVDPEPVFTSDETEEKNKYLLNLQKAGKEFAVKYILGNESWDAWVKKAESLGSKKLIDIYNKAQNR